MPDRYWEQLEEIFQQALDLPDEERTAFLAEACADDEDLRHRVDELIVAYRKADNFIESPAVPGYEPGLMAETVMLTGEQTLAESIVGRRVGAYKIVCEIGRGGMGAVYLAQRADEAFEKRVAIKLIKRGMDTDFILRRFRNERQILANLDHPGIARLLDGGTTEDGLPYFVMEYIEGKPIDLYCDHYHLSIRDRLSLFQKVCAAVDYAHRNFVLHRDIKPGNILVTAEGQPRLLDFGIAKLTNPDLAQEPVDQTITAMRLMTPEYASPEQVLGEPLSQASDLYSLGVLLYELLTGTRPYKLPSRSPFEIARVVCEEEPESPSDVIARLSRPATVNNQGLTTIEAICRNRNASADTLRRELAGDLDNIIMKALRKEPERRYASVEDMSVDIERFLGGLPITASSGFTFKSKEPMVSDAARVVRSLAVLPLKMLSPHEAPKDSENIFLGIGLADALITRLTRMRQIAVRPTSSVVRYSDHGQEPLTAGKALAVDFVLDGHMLKVGERIRITMQLVDVGDGSVLWASQFDEQYRDILSLQDSISAQVARSLVPHLSVEEEEELARRGTNNVEAYEAYLRGRYHWHTYTEEGLARAIVYFYEAIALDPSYARAYTGVADYYNWLGTAAVLPPSECFEAAKEAARKAIELDPHLSAAYASLAFAVWAYDWDTDESERLFKQSIEINPNYVQAHEWYSSLHGSRGRHNDAIREMKRAQELDPQAASVAAMFGFRLYNARRFDESKGQFERALSLDPEYYVAMEGLGLVWSQMGEHEKAIELCRRANLLSNSSALTLWTLGFVLADAGQSEEAKQIIAELDNMSGQRYVPPYFFALIETRLGNFDTAFNWIDKSLNNRDYWIHWLAIEPRFDPLKKDPRFESYLSRIRSVAATSKDLGTVTGPVESQTQPLFEAPFDSTPQAQNEEVAVKTDGPRYVAVIASVVMLVALSALTIFKWSPWSSESIDVGTGSLVRLTNNPGTDKYPRVSPDGRKIVFSSNRDGREEIYVMNSDGSDQPQRLTVNSVDDRAPSWSPNGRKIAFDHIFVPDVESDIYVMDADGSNQTNLTSAPGYDTRASFSPDGKRIVFASNRGSNSRDNFDLYVMNADGSNVVRLTNDPQFENDPVWSPDGARIAFTRMTEDNSFEIYVIGADGKNEINITNNPAIDIVPSWSPDGKSIAFSSNRDLSSRADEESHIINANGARFRIVRKSMDMQDIYVMNVDGSNARRVTDAEANEGEASWMPDSHSLVFNTDRDGNYEIYRISIDQNPDIVKREEANTESKTIAVLPFITEGTSEMDTSLGVGLADVLTSKLGQIKQLSVRPTSAVRRYEGRPTDPQEVGRELAVSHVVIGSLRSVNEGVQVAAQLISVDDGKVLWAEKFDEKMTDISMLQASISERVLRALTLELTPIEREQIAKLYTRNSEAYQLYLVGRYYLGRRTVTGINQAIELFNRSIKSDPNFALAYAGLADCYALLNLYGTPPPKDAYARARENATKALSLDQSLAEAHTSLAYVKFYHDRDRSGAEAEFLRSIELNPSYATARHWLAIALTTMGRYDEAIESIRRAHQLDPRSAIITSASGMILFYARRYDEALQECRKSIEIDPGIIPAHKVMRWIYQATGNHDEAMAAFQRERSFSGGGDGPGWQILLSQVQAINDKTTAKATLERAVSSPEVKREGDFLTYEIALAYAAIDDRDKSLEWLAKAEAVRNHGFNFAEVDPRLDDVRSDPRFAGLIARSGL